MNIGMHLAAHKSDSSPKALRATGEELKKMVGVNGATTLDLIEAIYRYWYPTKRCIALEGAGITTLEQLEAHVDEALRNPPPDNPWVEYELRGARERNTLGHHFGFAELPQRHRVEDEESAPTPPSD